jgi:glycosyltransferase involved in cell wall biosynthesis
MSDIDVVVPCYRYGRYLRQCVDSILSQDVDARVLIIDDCSPDDSGEIADAIAAADSRVLAWRHTVNAGHIRTYNEGIEWASAEYFLLLSADDYLTPGALGRALAMMRARPDVGFVFGNALAQNDRGEQQPIRPLAGRVATEADIVFTGRHFLTISQAANLVPTATAVVRTHLQKRVGGYQADLPHSADMAMWWRFAALASVGYIDQFQAIYRHHGDNMSTTYSIDHGLPDLLQRRDALRWLGQYPGPLSEPALRAATDRALALDAVNFASMALNAGRVDSAEKLLQFAREQYPPVWRSWLWAKVAVKRALPRVLMPATNERRLS